MAEIDPDDVYDVSDLSKGDRVEGRVQRVTNYGAFVRVGQITGLLHISNMSWEHVDDPGDIVSVGETIEVMVLDVDEENHRVSFGLKQLEDDDEE
ncbi:MAG: S1 RNA-binding domain-containing protein, partial [Kiritimatiellae bacterium]|nr:S1 RNA-binding domain-containing protein [Kiritimatiellia bacterium]